MMNAAACIFDLDGVIVDTARYHFMAWKRLTDELGIPFTEEDNERLKGVSRMASLDIILEIGHRNIDEKLKQEYATRKNNWYIEYISKMTPDEILPGCISFIKELRKADIRVAVGSASKNTPMMLWQMGILLKKQNLIRRFLLKLRKWLVYNRRNVLFLKMPSQACRLLLMPG
jgi:beta-phosphoglucomutase